MLIVDARLRRRFFAHSFILTFKTCQYIQISIGHRNPIPCFFCSSEDVQVAETVFLAGVGAVLRRKERRKKTVGKKNEHVK